MKSLKYQVPFILINSQQGEFRKERPVKHIADFVYDELQEDGSWKHIVEDTKVKNNRLCNKKKTYAIYSRN